MKITNWVEFEDEHGVTCRIRASYGLQKIGSQEPYVSITSSTQQKVDGHWHEDIFGCQHELIAEHIPELEPLIRWHLCGVNSGPMHYVQNAVHFWEKKGELDNFERTVVFGAVEGDSLEPLVGGSSLRKEGAGDRKARVERWLRKRLPALLEVMKDDLKLLDKTIAGGCRRRETSLLEDLCEEHKIVSSCVFGAQGGLPEGYDSGATAWTVTLSRPPHVPQFDKNDQSLTITTSFFMGSAHSGEPKAHDVLDSLLIDAEMGEYDSFEQWASDFGYDTDSRKAEQTYRQCRELAPQLHEFLGELHEEFRAAQG